MRKHLDYNTFADSQFAIKEYMNWKVENYYMHEAKISVLSEGKVQYDGILNVIPRIETNNSFIDIIADSQFERNYYLRYTNEYQIFSFLNGTLSIQCEDRWGNFIEINIASI